MSAKIYTKTGDEGQTGLLGGKRVAKSDPRIEACGNLDELNAWLGLLGDLIPEKTADPFFEPFLRRIQDRLFTAGALLACEPGRENKFILPGLSVADVSALEKAIDEMEALMPPVKNFILPGGHSVVSQVHIARAVCRKAERSVVLLGKLEPGLPDLVVPYLNRLSDYLFVLARATARKLKVPEIPWIPQK